MHIAPYVSSLSYNVVSSIIEDEQRNLWVGTEGGGLNYMDQSGHVYHQYKHRPDDPRSLSHNHVKSLYLDKEIDRCDDALADCVPSIETG